MMYINEKKIYAQHNTTIHRFPTIYAQKFINKLFQNQRASCKFRQSSYVVSVIRNPNGYNNLAAN